MSKFNELYESLVNENDDWSVGFWRLDLDRTEELRYDNPEALSYENVTSEYRLDLFKDGNRFQVDISDNEYDRSELYSFKSVKEMQRFFKKNKMDIEFSEEDLYDETLTEDEDDEEADPEDVSALYIDDADNEYDITFFMDNDDESDDDEEEIDDDDEYDDIDEALKRKKVIRGGKKLKKFATDKEGYKVQMVKGRPKEVRMKPDEIRKRKKAAKKAARKRKTKSSAQAQRKRAKSIKKRKSFGG